MLAGTGWNLTNWVLVSRTRLLFSCRFQCNWCCWMLNGIFIFRTVFGVVASSFASKGCEFVENNENAVCFLFMQNFKGAREGRYIEIAIGGLTSNRIGWSKEQRYQIGGLLWDCWQYGFLVRRLNRGRTFEKMIFL